MIDTMLDNAMECDPSEIIPNKLYLGSILAATDEYIIKDLGITAILNCGTDKLFQNVPKDVFYLCLNMEDSIDQDLYIDEALSFIEQNKNVLVHCKAGISRSSSIVIAFIMKQKKMKFERAFEFVKNCRNCIAPNLGFIQQLIEYENTIFGKRQTSLVDYFTQFLIGYYSNYTIEEFRVKVEEIVNKYKHDRKKMVKEVINIP